MTAMSDMVNHPPHYSGKRGPRIRITVGTQTITRGIECIEVIRHITDMRLANAMKYIWRVAFGGKDNDHQDIEKAIWYLRDWLDHPAEGTDGHQR
jgi:hypothetical protein